MAEARGEFVSLDMSATFYDGTVWPLTNPSTGVLLLPDVVGLGVGPLDLYFTSSPGVAGSRYRGERALSRPVVWPLGVYSDGSSQAWLELDRALWRGLRRPLVWSVTQQPTGETRTLACRFVSEPSAFAHDPSRIGWAEYEVNLVAEDPYWAGEPIVREFGASETEPFIPVGGGPPFHISEGSTIASASIENPGDVDAWPVYTFAGPMTAVEVAIDGRAVGTTTDLLEGDVLVIDSDPRRQSATLNGTRVRGIITPHDFAPVPAGGITALDVTMVGTGTVAVRLVPRYERAW
jgi:hypothetical protein